MDESALIGAVYAVETKELRAIINPDRDEQLDDPSWLSGDEPLAMLKIPRIELSVSQGHIPTNDIADFIDRVKARLGALA